MSLIDYEQQHLLFMIERMQREGRSEREIASAMLDAGHGGKRPRPAPVERPIAHRLVRWTLARIWA